MAKSVRFASSVRRCAGTRLGALGYELIESKELERDGILVFRRQLHGDMHAFITFDLKPHRIPSLPRSFVVRLGRNKGDEPHPKPGPASEGEGWFETGLSFLLWTVFGVEVAPPHSYHKKPSAPWEAYLYELQTRIPPEHREWYFLTPEDLEAQLHDAVDKLIQFALPWLEDRETRDLR